MDAVNHFFQTILLMLSWQTEREGKREKGMDLEAGEGNLQLVSLAGLGTVPEKPRPQIHLKRIVEEHQKVLPGRVST